MARYVRFAHVHVKINLLAGCIQDLYQPLTVWVRCVKNNYPKCVKVADGIVSSQCCSDLYDIIIHRCNSVVLGLPICKEI